MALWSVSLLFDRLAWTPGFAHRHRTDRTIAPSDEAMPLHGAPERATDPAALHLVGVGRDPEQHHARRVDVEGVAERREELAHS